MPYEEILDVVDVTEGIVLGLPHLLKEEVEAVKEAAETLRESVRRSNFRATNPNDSDNL